MGPTVDEELVEVLANSETDEAVREVVMAHLGPAVREKDVDPLFAEGQLYLAAVSVRGFRGVGPPARLNLRPQRGLTLVVGPNGSGKSSFAEAVERVLTGTVERWVAAKADGRENWRNVGADDKAKVAVELRAERAGGPFTLGVEWDRDDDLPDGRATLRRPGAPHEKWDPGRWRAEMTASRPLLPYSALRQAISGTPAELFDAFNGLLGLGGLTALDDALRGRAKAVDDLIKAEADARAAVVRAVEASGVPELTELLDALRKRGASPEVIRPTLQDLGVGTGRSMAPAVPFGRLNVLAVAEMLDDLAEIESAQATVTAGAGALAERAERLAALIGSALDLHVEGETEACPVCGEGTLNDAWRVRALVEQDGHRRVSSELAQARAALRTTANRLLGAVQGGLEPTELVPSSPALVESSAAVRERLKHIGEGHPGASADDLAGLLGPLAELVDRCRVEAIAVLGDLAARKQPVDAAVGQWVHAAATAVGAPDEKKVLSAARSWLRVEIERMRAERLDAINSRFLDTWAKLRQSSAIELQPLVLQGVNTRREAKPACTIDGHAAAARGVLSQGELHAVALSMFVPRALQPGSAFGFLLIDDPVQALDQAKVDGLAEVLRELATERQVVVFTHDDRLPEAIDRLGIAADVLRVERGTGSKVEVKPGSDPVRRAIEEAHALASDKEIEYAVAIRAVAGFCRAAVEAQGLRRYRRTSTKTVEELDAELATRPSMWDCVELGLWGERTGKTLDRVRNRPDGKRAARVLGAINAGSHEVLADWQPRQLVHDVARVLSDLFGATT